MYYNIKIKTIDSEFILESENRRIIEKEMDAYFALFFGVSDDFMSKIKNIDLTKENLVSIDEIEKHRHHSDSCDEVVYYESSDAFDSSHENTGDEIEFIHDNEDEPIEIIDEHSSKDNSYNEIGVQEHTDENELILKNEPRSYEPKVEITEHKPKAPTVEPSSRKEIKVDFRLFLAGFIISDISNQFMACVFYIKNILKEDGATLKTINANLIKATGTIASMSVVSELVDKNYIAHKEVDGMRKYFITPAGEEYFTKKYRD